MEQVENKGDTGQNNQSASHARVIKKGKPAPGKEKGSEMFYRLQRRPADVGSVAWSPHGQFKKNDVVLFQAEHGLEPATVVELVPYLVSRAGAWKKKVTKIVRRANRSECEKFAGIAEKEREAFCICKSFIEKRNLPMHLVRVERFFDGSKIIFFFTAENRVDFRELVRDLVQEFRTRVEMRQIGVRHEAKMLGGIGCCGRPLCCVSFINKFQSVSIRMAKDQDLPLNPAKISGACNRLLCCLGYEASTYRTLKKGLPKPGKKIMIDGRSVRVCSINALASSFTVADPEYGQRVVSREEWQRQQKTEQEK